jgi:uncharacterized membrane protein
MFCSALATKVALGAAVACGGFSGAHAADFHKVEVKAPVVQDFHKDWNKVVVKRVAIVKSQNDCQRIALSHCAGTVKKVEKFGHIYNFTIFGADHHEHVYQVNEQTGSCGCVR